METGAWLAAGSLLAALLAAAVAAVLAVAATALLSNGKGAMRGAAWGSAAAAALLAAAAAALLSGGGDGGGRDVERELRGEVARLEAELERYTSLARRGGNTWFAEEAHAAELRRGEDALETKLELLGREEARFPDGHWLAPWEEHLDRTTPAAFRGEPPALDCGALGSMALAEEELAPAAFGAEQAERAAEALRECGVVYLDNFFTREQIDALRGAYEELRRTPEAEEVWRYPVQGRGRIEYMLPFRAPFNDTSVYGDRRLLDIVRAFLGPRFKMELQTVIESLPGAGEQRWHQGWQSLFHPEERLPPYAVVVGVPLVDVTPEMGPTEVCPGKKRRFYRGYTCPGESVQVASTAGTVVIFDYKTLHRGPANRSQKSRPMLSLVFSVDWFVNTWAFTNRAMPFLQTLHQRRYWEQSFWHSPAPDKV